MHKAIYLPLPAYTNYEDKHHLGIYHFISTNIHQNAQL